MLERGLFSPHILDRKGVYFSEPVENNYADELAKEVGDGLGTTVEVREIPDALEPPAEAVVISNPN